MDKKKILIVLFIIIIIGGIVVLFSFKDDNKESLKIGDISGTYDFNRVEKNGSAVTPSEVFGTGSTYGGTLVINKDNTYTEYVGITGEDDNYVGTYKISDTKIIFTNKNNVEQVGTITKDMISIEDKVYKEGYTLVFKKEKDKETIIKETLTDYFKGNYGNDIKEIKYTDVKILENESNNISFEVTYNFILNKGVDPKKYAISNGEIDGLIIKNKKSIGVIKKDISGNYIISSLGKK